MTRIIVFSLEGCPYSIDAEHKLSGKKKVKIVKVTHDDKHKFKAKNKMDTFPQIFLQSKKNLIKIGGNSELTNLIRVIEDGKNKKDLDYIVEKLNNIKATKKEKLKLIKILLE